MLVIGSKAFDVWFANKSKVNDIDVIAYKSDIDYLINASKCSEVITKEDTITLRGCSSFGFFDKSQIEIILADNSKSDQMYLEIMNANTGLNIATPEILFSIKKSHIHYPIKFEKHIIHYCFLYEKLEGIDKFEEITKIRSKETEQRLGKLKTPSLKKSVGEFFGQSEKFVKSFFTHDDMHRMVAHYNEPLYEKMQAEEGSVFCSKDLWNNFKKEDKIKTVLEEAYVIALERKILPMLFSGGVYWSDEGAFDWALKRICTNLTSGFFRDFATNNYLKIKESYNKNYVLDFLEKYNSSLIKRIV
jgi:hypothetical protein